MLGWSVCFITMVPVGVFYAKRRKGYCSDTERGGGLVDWRRVAGQEGGRGTAIRSTYRRWDGGGGGGGARTLLWRG